MIVVFLNYLLILRIDAPDRSIRAFLIFGGFTIYVKVITKVIGF